MNEFYAFLLGALQGITEFIPISSSGHLSLAEMLLGLSVEGQEDIMLTFDILIHLATAFGIIIYYMKDIYKMVTEGLRQLAYLALASVPVAVVGFFFTEYFAAAKTSPLRIGIGFLGTAIFLMGGEVFARDIDDKHERVGAIDSFLIGLAQAAALMPGVSRSGATIGSALICGVGREKAVQFSFLLGIPAFLGAATYKLIEFEPAGAEALGFTTILIGTLTAFALTFVAIPLTIKIVKTKNLVWFAGYCFLLGIGTIIYELVG
ncbi:MAG: undecaprenyl-diphosphate phosphatase [Planctomycetota bacterium]|nr:undecaprenyl-diphosphate phosphatase [Planctomycetota bacterium]